MAAMKENSKGIFIKKFCTNLQHKKKIDIFFLEEEQKFRVDDGNINERNNNN